MKGTRFQLFSHDVADIIRTLWEENDLKIKQVVNGVKQEISLRDHLNVTFFSFRQQVESTSNASTYCDINEWREKAMASTEKGSANVELVGDEKLIAPDIDFVNATATLEFIIQAEKAEAMEVYWKNLTNKVLGKSRQYTTSANKQARILFSFGELEKQDGIDATQFGQTITYYTDVTIAGLVGGKDYSSSYLKMLFADDITGRWHDTIFTEMTIGYVNVGDDVNTQALPQQMGRIPQTNGLMISLTLWDLSNQLTNKKINQILLKTMAYGTRQVNNVATDIFDENDVVSVGEYEPPRILLRFKEDDDPTEYLYATYPINIEKTVQVGAFNAFTVTLSADARNTRMHRRSEDTV